MWRLAAFSLVSNSCLDISMIEQTIFRRQPLGRWTEDLHWQALRSIELGNALCKCEGYYHSIWSLLRAVGVVRGVKTEQPLLESVLAPHLNNDAKFLIAGSADPGLFASIGRISGPNSPAITIIDKCRTPLELIQEFADMKGAACRILQNDIFELDGSERWGKILLHYTMDFVEPGQRRKFLERLMISLEPGGRLICVAKTNQRGAATKGEKLESAFLANAKNAISKSSFKPILENRNFERMLQDYGKAATVRRLRMIAAEELKDLFDSSGFSIVEEHTAQRENIIRGDPDASGSVFQGSVDVTIIVAERNANSRLLQE